MRKLVAMTALAVGLMIGSVANAAAVDIFVRQTNATTWELSATTNGSTALGAVNLLTTGLETMTLNAANVGISSGDSVFQVDAGLGDGRGLAIINNALIGTTPQAIAPPGSVNLLIATFTGPGPVNVQDTSEFLGENNGITNPAGGAIFDYSLTIVPTPPVPEPIAMVLIGLGLAAVGVVRRSA